jgi:L-threonylcarbamoyladenylate synthase
VLVFEPSRKKMPSRSSLVSTIDALPEPPEEVGVMLPDGWDASYAPLVYRWGAWGDGDTLARRLFAGLRELDERGAKVIVCPVPEMDGIGEAIRDRLRKAAREK